jgi:Zn-dependent peptidase ImmA (M78 family)
MIPIRIPRYTREQIEDRAALFLRQHWDPNEIYVDVELIIEAKLGIAIDYTRFDDFDGTIAKDTVSGRLTIVVNEELANSNPNRYRYTLAQELGHLLLHEELIRQITDLESASYLHEKLSDQAYQTLERDANCCAAAILMPAERFRESSRSSYAKWFRLIHQEIGKTPPGDLQARVVKDLAKLYRVSPQAASIRLQRPPLKLYARIYESAAKGISAIK